MPHGLCIRCTEISRLRCSPKKEGTLLPEDHHGLLRRAEGLAAVAVAGRSLHGLEMSLQISGLAEESRQTCLELMEILGARGE